MGIIVKYIFNCILAYGKSELTKLLRDMLKSVVIHRPTKFRTNYESILEEDVNATLDEISKAGLMVGLDGRCRTVISDEADIIFADVGLFLSHNMSVAAKEMNCRGW